MSTMNAIPFDADERREAFQPLVEDAESAVNEALLELSDGLSGRNIDAIISTTQLASKLFILAYQMVLGLAVDAADTQQQVREAMVGLSQLADLAFPSGEEDDEAWDRA